MLICDSFIYEPAFPLKASVKFSTKNPKADKTSNRLSSAKMVTHYFRYIGLGHDLCVGLMGRTHTKTRSKTRFQSSIVTAPSSHSLRSRHLGFQLLPLNTLVLTSCLVSSSLCAVLKSIIASQKSSKLSVEAFRMHSYCKRMNRSKLSRLAFGNYPRSIIIDYRLLIIVLN